MQQRSKRYYIIQDEDQAIVRSVPISRRAQSVMAADERATTQPVENAEEQDRPASVAERVRSVVRRGAAAAGGRR